MTKNEWLDDFRETLMTEIPQHEIDNNVMFYRDYIERESAVKSIGEVLQTLGEPRLIAKTIIDTYKMQSGGQDAYDGNQSYDYTDMDKRYQSQDTGSGDTQNSRGHFHASYEVKTIKWYHKAIFFAILTLIICFAIVVGGFLLKLLFTFAVPLFLIIFIYSLVRRK